MWNKIVGRIPHNWNDFGTYALKEKEQEVFSCMITEQLPAEVSWLSTNEFIAPVDYDGDFDSLIEKIIHKAFKDFCKMDDKDIDTYWTEHC